MRAEFKAPWSTPDEAESEAGPEAEPTVEAAADHRALVAVLAADPDWTKLVEGCDVCYNFMFVEQTEAEIIVAAMRELLRGENGELQNLTEDGHIRLCVLASALYQYDDLSQFNEVVRDLSKLMLDADEFEHIMNEYSWYENAWRTPEETHFWLEKPDTQADIRRWWFLTLPFDKTIHSQLLAAIGTTAKKRKKKKKSGSKRK